MFSKKLPRLPSIIIRVCPSLIAIWYLCVSFTIYSDRSITVHIVVTRGSTFIMIQVDCQRVVRRKNNICVEKSEPYGYPREKARASVYFRTDAIVPRSVYRRRVLREKWLTV